MNSPNSASSSIPPSDKAPQNLPAKTSGAFVFGADSAQGNHAFRGIPNLTTLKYPKPSPTATLRPLPSVLVFQPTGVGFPDGRPLEFGKASIPSHVQPATGVSPRVYPIDDPDSTDARTKAPPDPFLGPNANKQPPVCHSVSESLATTYAPLHNATNLHDQAPNAEEKRPEVNKPSETTNTTNPTEPANVQAPPTEPVSHSDKSSVGGTATPNEPSNAQTDPEREQEPAASASSQQPKVKPEFATRVRAIESRSLTPFSSEVLASLRKGVEDALCGKPFGDIKVYANSRRSADGTLHEPKVLVVPGSLLMAVSKEFQPLLNGSVVDFSDYDSDSDYEEDASMHGHDVCSLDEDRLDWKTPPSSPGVQAEFLQGSTSDARAATGSVATAQVEAEGKCIQRGAYRTWKAMLFYLLTGHIDFVTHAPHPEGVPRQEATLGGNKCSPRSMYHLAERFNIVPLKGAAFAEYLLHISEKNIVHELFSDFAWRHADILNALVERYCIYCKDSHVQKEMAKVMEQVATGRLPHCASVLLALNKKLLNTAL